MEKAKRARTAETPKQPSLCLRLRAPYFYPDYDEGVAIHIGPEPCVGSREGTGEASAGERAGQPSSRESLVDPGADVVPTVEGNTDGGVSASPRTARRGPRPLYGGFGVKLVFEPPVPFSSFFLWAISLRHEIHAVTQ